MSLEELVRAGLVGCGKAFVFTWRVGKPLEGC